MSDETIHIVTGNPEKAREAEHALALILGEWIMRRYPAKNIQSPANLPWLTGLARELGHDVPTIRFVSTDLPERQDDWESIARFKALEALSRMPEETVVVEDVTFGMAALGHSIAPYIKFLLADNAPDDLHAIVTLGMDRGRSARAEERCTFALARPGSSASDVEIVSAIVGGDIVAPVGTHGFGYDPIFRPDGKLETYAQMGPAKAEVSARGRALRELAARIWPELVPPTGLFGQQ